MATDYIKMFLHRKGKRITRFAKEEDILSFIRFIQSQYVHVDLVRIGGKGDGGYLMPDDFDGVRHCFSPGVADKAGFEQHISEVYGIKSFLADASVDASPVDNVHFDFEKKFLGSVNSDEFTTLADWLLRKDQTAGDNDMVLQMDIEGAEFDVLIDTSTETLQRFRMIVIEFHGMDRLFEPSVLPLFRSIFNKLSHHFQIAHIHPNNCGSNASYRGIEIPPVVEITFIRKDRVAKIRQDGPVQVPHPQDQHNVPYNSKVNLPDIWWKN